MFESYMTRDEICTHQAVMLASLLSGDAAKEYL